MSSIASEMSGDLEDGFKAISESCLLVVLSIIVVEFVQILVTKLSIVKPTCTSVLPP